MTRPSYTIPLPHGRPLVLGERPLIMGILNVTPDSFAEAVPLVNGSSAKEEDVDLDAAIERALRLEAEGADIIDVGGESTRPGARPVPARDELTRVVPVIEALAARVRIPISVDTTKAAVARGALAAGAVLVNDISGLAYDAELGRVVAGGEAALVLMHTRGRSQAMYAQAQYVDVIDEVASELRVALSRAVRAGVPAERIILDPGIGFAKHPSDSYGVLARLPELQSALDRPLLVGPSRKSFLSAEVGDRPPAQRDWGTAAAVAAAVIAGAHMVRVHAVAEMVQVVNVAEAIRRAGDQRVAAAARSHL